MKTWKTITITTLAVVAAALLVSSAYAMGPFGMWGNSYIGTNTAPNGYGGYGMGGGMMGGGYGYGYGTTPTQQGTTTQTTVYPYQFGGGCMGAFGYGYGYTTAAPYTYTGTPLNITTAQTIATNYVTSLNNPDLTVKQVEEYTANFYVQVTEKSTGNGAFELLIDKYTGSIYPEMGPNMMWNTKYGMMRGGILGGIFGTPTTTMTITATQAKANAQQYLNSYLPGTTTEDITTFYGYYTIEVMSNGSPFGMLSVNGYTGQVWYHTWHGNFVEELEVS